MEDARRVRIHTDENDRCVDQEAGKALRMQSSSGKSLRGWAISGLVGLSLTGGLFGLHQYLESHQIKKSRFYSARSHAARQPVALPDLMAEIRQQDHDRFAELPPEAEWIEYRTAPSISASVAMDFVATGRILPPQTSHDLYNFDEPVVGEPQWENAGRQKFVSTSIPITTKQNDEPDARQEPDPLEVTRSPVNLATRPCCFPQTLISELESLRTIASFESGNYSIWCNDVHILIQRIENCQDVSHPELGEYFDRLLVLAEVGQQLADRLATELSIVDRQLRLAHGLYRRALVGKSIWECASRSAPKLVYSANPATYSDLILTQVSRIRKMTSASANGKVWEDYLLLDEWTRLARSPSLDLIQARDLARGFLSRVSTTRATPEQRRFLTSEPVRELALSIQPLATAPVDYKSLLSDLNAIEEDRIHRVRSSVASSIQSLRFSGDSSQVALADVLNNYYRNANIRMAISSELLQRFLPESQVVHKPVRDQILGSDTRGASTIKTKLSVELVPDTSAWNFILKLNGDVASNTRSEKGPAVFYNASSAVVDTARHIRIDADNTRIRAENPSVTTSDMLQGFKTDFDSLPILGDLFRTVARQQFDEQRGLAQRIVRRKIADTADREFDQELHKQLHSAERMYKSKLLSPLNDLNLNPLIVDMQTTERRLIARYRVAGDLQLAAHTPRPIAPSDSHLSIQIHESSVNNAIEQIAFGDEPCTLLELSDRIASALQQQPWKLTEDIPDDVAIRFAKKRPMTIEFQDGKVLFTLRIDQLQQGDRLNLKRFSIIASYVPVVDGMWVSLQLDGPISVDGERIGVRERLPLRTIFSRVFASHRNIDLIPAEFVNNPRAAGLAISQMACHDGWLAVAVSRHDSPHVAQVKAITMQTRR